MRLFSLVLVLLLASCNKSETTTAKPVPASTVEVTTPAPVVVAMETSAEPHQASQPIGPAYEVANVKKVFTVKIESVNYTDKQKEKLSRAEYLIGVIFNSVEYKAAVGGYQFDNKSQFDSNKGLSNTEVYAILYEGAEAIVPAKNYQMDLKVKMYTGSYSKVVGYTTPSSMIVNTNSKYHNIYSACDVSSNLTHEWTHKMGFDHKSAGSYGSVPYAHNEIIRRLCTLAENNKLTPL